MVIIGGVLVTACVIWLIRRNRNVKPKHKTK